MAVKFHPGDLVRLNAFAIAHDKKNFNGRLFAMYTFPLRVIEQTGYVVKLDTKAPYKLLNVEWLEKAEP